MPTYADRVVELTQTPGTGPLALAGAVTGFRRFASVLSVGATCFYAVEALTSVGVPQGDWEVGIGTYTVTDSIDRTTVLASSNGNLHVDFADGSKRIWIDVPASAIAGLLPRDEAAATYTTTAQVDARFAALASSAGYINAAGAPVQSVAGRAGAVTLSQSDIAGLTITDSPTFANVGGGTITATTKFLVADGTAAAPSIARAFNTSTGFYFPNNTTISVAHNGVLTGQLASAFWLTPTTLNISATDLALTRDAANILAQRNGTSPQTFRLYNTYTDSLNYERLTLSAAAAQTDLFTEKAGTGAVRDLRVYASGNLRLGSGGQASGYWILSGGHLFPTVTNTYDLGSVANSIAIRSIYWGTQALAPDGTTALPSYAFSSANTTGFRYAATGNIVMVGAGGDRVGLLQSGVQVPSTGSVQFSSGAVTGTTDVSLFRDAAGILAQRNGVNAQTIRVYNTYTDAANYERGALMWETNALVLASENAGTGTGRVLKLRTASSSTGLEIQYGTTSYWRFATGGNAPLSPMFDGTQDIGAPTAKVNLMHAKGYYMLSGTADPTTANITAGYGVLWKNTTSGTVKLWVNDGGTLKSVALA